MSKRVRSTVPAAESAVPRIVRGTAPLDVLETTFRLLTAGPEPLSIDGAEIGHGLPAGRIGLHELAAILMHPSCGFTASDTVWRHLIAHARTGEAAWVVGAFGVALPGLRAAARRLARSHTGDVQAEVLAGFTVALRKVNPAGPGVAQRLCSTALVEARRKLRETEPARVDVTGPAPGSTPPPAPSGHPDFVLAHAVAAGVITTAEADLIGATRLEDVPLADYAERHGKGYWAAHKARARAEERLVAAIRSGELSDTDAAVIAEATTTVAADWEHRR
jgi:hypothetical protein